MKLDLLTDRYDFELDRKEKLTAGLALPAGILTVVGGVAPAMVRTFSYRLPFLSGPFLMLLVAAGLAFTACLVCLWNAYLSQKYTYLGYLTDLKTFENDMQAYARVVDSGEADIQQDFDHELERRIIAAADANTHCNDVRSGWLHRGRWALFFVVACMYVAAIVYVVDQVRFGMPTKEVPKPAPAAQPQATVPQKPMFPANRVIREGREPGSAPPKSQV